jgi:hypothetical protein
MGFFVHMEIISALKRVEFISDRMSYIILRGRWCHIIVLNVLAPIEDKIDDMKDTVYEEMDTFPKCHMKILLGDFNDKAGRKTSSNQLFGMKVYAKISNYNGVRLVSFAISKNFTVIPCNSQDKDIRVIT